MDNHVSPRPTAPLARELVRYAVVGRLASLVDVGLLVGLTSGGGVYYLHATTIAFGCGLLTSYPGLFINPKNWPKNADFRGAKFCNNLG